VLDLVGDLVCLLLNLVGYLVCLLLNLLGNLICLLFTLVGLLFDLVQAPQAHLVIKSYIKKAKRGISMSSELSN
jgi:hypothetical protein